MLDPTLLRGQLAETAERLKAARGYELDVASFEHLEAERNMREAMPRAVEWLLKEGYEFKVFE